MKMDMIFGMWNVRSHKAGSLITVAKEISKYKLDFVGVQGVRWDRGGTEPAKKYTFFNGMVNDNHKLSTDIFVYKEKHTSS
jgi:hypothetical protein